MADLDEDFHILTEIIDAGIGKFNEDEQNLINAWVGKLTRARGIFADLQVRNEYTRSLAKMITENEKLDPPFTEMPDEDLKPIEEDDGKREQQLDEQIEERINTSLHTPPPEATFQFTKMPCWQAYDKQRLGVWPKPKQSSKRHRSISREPIANEFEDEEEMAKVIANSKGQRFAEFVLAISRHTSDYGAELRAAMKTEISNFKEYVDHVLSQRLKDLTEVLDEEQNAELQKIKKDIDKWQLELYHCKKRIKELFPDFDLELYRRDKSYLKKVFNVEAFRTPREDSFKQWKEESCHRLKWYSEMSCKMARCNEQISKEINNVKSQAVDLDARETVEQQNHLQALNCELNEYKRLKLERDRLQKENSDLLAQLK